MHSAQCIFTAFSILKLNPELIWQCDGRVLYDNLNY
jgi:hypothetical protein